MVRFSRVGQSTFWAGSVEPKVMLLKSLERIMRASGCRVCHPAVVGCTASSAASTLALGFWKTPPEERGSEVFNLNWFGGRRQDREGNKYKSTRTRKKNWQKDQVNHSKTGVCIQENKECKERCPVHHGISSNSLCRTKRVPCRNHNCKVHQKGTF